MSSAIRSADYIMTEVIKDPKKLSRLKSDTLETLEELRSEAVENVPTTEAVVFDKWIYIVGISVLGLVVLITSVGAIWLTVNGHAIPEVLVAMGSAAIGAMVGLFAPSPLSKE